jgi:hypothetical protein
VEEGLLDAETALKKMPVGFDSSEVVTALMEEGRANEM